MPSTAAATGPVNSHHGHDRSHSDVVRDAAGRRLVYVTGDLLASLTWALQRDGYDDADILYKIGRRWGEADFRAFAERAPREFGVPSLDQMPFQEMLDAWRGPLTAAGWGTWRYDFRCARVGLPVVELSNSAAVGGPAGKPACHLYAGLFAAVFGALARRELAGVELECAAAGADRCRILVASTTKAATAANLRDEGRSANEILERLATPTAPLGVTEP
jgi:predicted hydrocarbon binding protein